MCLKRYTRTLYYMYMKRYMRLKRFSRTLYYMYMKRYARYKHMKYIGETRAPGKAYAR
jgi:hypothetical protein